MTLIYIIFIKSVNNNIFYFSNLELRLINGKPKASYNAFYSTSVLKAVKFYEDAEELKKLILKENRGLSGIYR